MIVVRHVDEDEIVNDCMDTSQDASESRRLTRQRWLADDEIEAMFPGGMAKLQAYADGTGTEDPCRPAKAMAAATGTFIPSPARTTRRFTIAPARNGSCSNIGGMRSSPAWSLAIWPPGNSKN
jgi:hypothetical protein